MFWNIKVIWLLVTQVYMKGPIKNQRDKRPEEVPLTAPLDRYEILTVV